MIYYYLIKVLIYTTFSLYMCNIKRQTCIYCNFIILYNLNYEYGEFMDNKRDRFVRLAESRVNKTLKDLDLIGNLSNRNNYDYSSDDVKKMFHILKSKIKEVETRFENFKKPTFKL